MGLKSFFCAVLITCLVAFTAHASDRNPTGETAHYDLNHDPDRTTSIFTDGQMDASVGNSDDSSGSVQFPVHVNYDVMTAFDKEYKGVSSMDVPAEYFSEEFLINLRQTKHYEGKNFKVNHIGYRDATDADGTVYPNCDRLLFYDIPSTTVQDLQIEAAVKFGNPVLGAIQLDVSGVYDGMDAKAGADYKP